jgi:hypothetical protein
VKVVTKYIVEQGDRVTVLDRDEARDGVVRWCSGEPVYFSGRQSITVDWKGGGHATMEVIAQGDAVYEPGDVVYVERIGDAGRADEEARRRKRERGEPDV